MLQLFPAPLLAEIGEILGAIITLGAIIFWVIQKIAEANKAVQKRAPRPAAPAARAAAQGGPQPAGQQADPLRNQVEEFLRRTNQGNPPRQAAPPARKPAQQMREIELLLDEEASPPPRRSVSAPLPSGTSQRIGSMPSDQRQSRPPAPLRKRKTLAERADERAAARTKAMAQKVSNLGQRIITEDRQFDDQLKAKFDHSVGTLASNTPAATEPVPRDAPAAQIAAMLANPDGVRQAIVINEILSRPTLRW
jgi:hypothetical protein